MQLLYDSQQLFTIKIVSTLRLPPPRASGRKREMDLYATTLPYLLLQENVCLGWNLIIHALFLHPTPDDCTGKRILIKAQEQEQASSGCGEWDSWRGQCKCLDKYLIQSYYMCIRDKKSLTISQPKVIILALTSFHSCFIMLGALSQLQPHDHIYYNLQNRVNSASPYPSSLWIHSQPSINYYYTIIIV